MKYKSLPWLKRMQDEEGAAMTETKLLQMKNKFMEQVAGIVGKCPIGLDLDVI